MKRIISIAAGLAALSEGKEVWATQFAADVVSYKSGTGFAVDWSSGAGYTNKEAVLGEPARETQGDWGGLITPFSPPHRLDQILSIGEGGEVTLKFSRPIRDEPLNPFGLDFIVFGGAGFTIINGDFIGGGITDGTLFGRANGETRVSVSVDGEAWFVLDPKRAPVFDGYHPSDGAGDFGLPVNPALVEGDFADGGLAKFTELYAGSGGGTGYDIGWAIDADGQPAELGKARYIRLEVFSGKAEVDAVSDVRPSTDNLAWHVEDFSADPLVNGWAVHGDKSLFEWDAATGSLAVTWDSERTNSLFHRPLGRMLTEGDAFAFAFDITLDEVKVGHRDGQPFTFEVALGLLNTASAKADEFKRGTGTDSPNLIEWDYFPDTGFGATVSPAIASGNSRFAAAFTFPAEMIPGELYSVQMEYDPAVRELRTGMLENGKAWRAVETVALPEEFDGFAVDAFSINSYTAKGSKSSLLARGRVDNVAIVADSSQPRITKGCLAEGQWRGRAFGLGSAVYVLERTADLRDWFPVENGVRVDGFNLWLSDEQTLVGGAFYRLRR
ncbi:MAG: hypothetical protein QGG00_10605 [Verrucomicrobiota bacterium]|jgi:hypothetical protein|nr:hypothetical protein [Verrucomicrobiota bacterium]MDP7051750.1 hypothetical protein [Verrucomicrobiota bacterium]